MIDNDCWAILLSLLYVCVAIIDLNGFTEQVKKESSEEAIHVSVLDHLVVGPHPHVSESWITEPQGSG